MEQIDGEFWENKYQSNDLGWDIGYVSTPIKEYIDQIADKSVKILIPGCGNSYEAEYLHENGFSNVHVMDISKSAIENFKSRVPSFPVDKIHHGNFFDHSETYELILEQTFFCALPPQLRGDYAEKMNSLISAGGKLAGLLFNFPLTESGPPFGGSKEEYLELFSENFYVKTLSTSYNSIKPRKGSELFMILQKK